MDDVSLDDLISQLQQAQERKSSVRLSERNVVELITKLQTLGIIGEDLLHSTNGREYLTTDHLCKEIQTAVHQAGGRLALVDLPGLVGVDLIHCEAQAARAVQQSGGSLLSMQGELFTTRYFDHLAAEVNELLQEAGSLALGDLARRFNLGADLLMSTVGSQLGSVIAGRLEAGLLYTSGYLSRIKAQLRGSLRGASAPVSLAALFKELQLEGAANFGKAAAAMVEELLSEGFLDGSLKANTWLPSVHSRSQQAAVANFYSQNSYIEYDTVAITGISGAQAYLTTTFPGGIALESAYVAPTLLTQLDAQVSEALAGGAWLDLMPLLPSVISPVDAATLVSRCPSLQAGEKGRGESGSGRQVAGTCVVSSAFLQEVEARVLEHARLAANETLRQGKGASTGPAGSHGPSEGGGAKGSASGKKPAGSTAPKPDSDDDDDWADTRGKKGKKGKGKAGAKSGKGSGTTKGAPPAKAAASSKTDDAGKAWLLLPQLADKVVEWYPDMDGAGQEDGLPHALAQRLRPAALAEYEKAIAAVFLAGAEARRRRREAALAELVGAYERLQLYGRGSELLEGLEPPDPAAVTATRRHLVRGLGSQAFDALLRHQQVDIEGEAGSEARPDGEGASEGSLSVGERNAIIAALPKDVAASAKAVSEQLAGTSVDEVVRGLEGLAEAAGLRLRRLEKKSEKALLASVRAHLEEQLRQESQPSSALSLALPLLALQVRGRALSVPGKALTGVIRLLKGGLPEETYDLVVDFHTRVVACLKAQGSPEGPAPLEEELQARLPDLKAAAKVGDPPAP